MEQHLATGCEAKKITVLRKNFYEFLLKMFVNLHLLVTRHALLVTKDRSF